MNKESIEYCKRYIYEHEGTFLFIFSKKKKVLVDTSKTLLGKEESCHR